jgi:hypothetical protein
MPLNNTDITKGPLEFSPEISYGRLKIKILIQIFLNAISIQNVSTTQQN